MSTKISISWIENPKPGSDELVEALRRITDLIEEGYTSGFEGTLSWDLTEEEEEIADWAGGCPPDGTGPNDFLGSLPPEMIDGSDPGKGEKKNGVHDTQRRQEC